MGLTVTHTFTSVKAEQTDPTLVGPNEWNAAHTIVDTSRELISVDFNFTALLPGGSLTSGITNTVTLTPVPKGVNGTNTKHLLYVSGGTGTAETVLITGGTAVSGAASGTITFVPTNNHTGAWSVQSATQGIQEAIWYLCITYGFGRIKIPGGQYTIQGSITVPGAYPISIRGHGMYNTILNMVSPANFVWDVGSGAYLGAIDFGSMLIQDSTGSFRLSGAMLETHNRAIGLISDLYLGFCYNGFNCDRSSGAICTNITIGCSNYGLYINTNGLPGSGGAQSSGTFENIVVITDGTNANAYRIEGQTVGLRLINCSSGTIANSATNYSLVISQTSLGPTNEIEFADCIFDGHGIGALLSGYGTYANNYIIFNNCKFTSLNTGISIINKMQGIQINGGLITPAGAGSICIALGDCQNIQIDGVILNATTGGGGSQAIQGTGVASNIQITNCEIGRISTTDFGIGLSGTPTNWRIGKCDFGAVTTPLSLGANLVTLDGDNIGIDDITGTVSDAATLTFPANAFFTLTGTGTAVTAVAGLWKGRRGRFIATNATPPQFTAGATIGNTLTPAQNVMVEYYFDGTKIWLK